MSHHPVVDIKYGFSIANIPNWSLVSYPLDH